MFNSRITNKELNRNTTSFDGVAKVTVESNVFWDESTVAPAHGSSSNSSHSIIKNEVPYSDIISHIHFNAHQSSSTDR
jgi:hypothetical protein